MSRMRNVDRFGLLRFIALCLACVMLCASISASAEEAAVLESAVDESAVDESAVDESTAEADEAPVEEIEPVPEDPRVLAIATLSSLISLRDELRVDISELNRQAMAAQNASDKQQILSRVEKLNADLNTTLRNIEEIAAGAHLDSLRATDQPAFDLTQELFSLLEPAINEMKDMTSHVRQKAEQKEKIAYYETKVPVTTEAIRNLSELLQETEDPQLKKALEAMLESWRKQDTFLQAELQSAKVQLAKLESSEQTLADASQSYLKQFFQNRGRYLGQALLVVVLIMVLSQLLLRALRRFVKGYQKPNRSLQFRLVDLSHRILTGLLAILGPMVVFYIAEDWLLFSLGLLLLLGIALGLRQAIPRYWQQVQLFLNVGTVREGERLEYNNIPWLVKQINVYTMLENPAAGFSQRVKIDDLVDMRSRPLHKGEPWFPCRMGDWVVLNDTQRGKVVGLSQEFVELVERGGAHKTYTTRDFLAREPLNLSVNFRLKESIGITYNLQSEAVTSVPELLMAHIKQRLEEEGYGEKLLNLRVEFERASASSLDILVIADFKGELAELYNRLRRSLQRYCVEACTRNGWEIPFTQLTLHGAQQVPGASQLNAITDR